MVVYLRPLAHAAHNVAKAMTTPTVWVSWWRYKTTSHTMTDYDYNIHHQIDQAFPDFSLKTGGGLGYEVILCVLLFSNYFLNL